MLSKFYATSIEQRALVGDSFGILNALFSGLSLTGVIIAILLQSRELSLQRSELALTRDELKRSAEANEKSASLLVESQAFEVKKLRVEALSSLLDSETAKLNAHQASLLRLQQASKGVSNVKDRYSEGANKRIANLEEEIREEISSLSKHSKGA